MGLPQILVAMYLFVLGLLFAAIGAFISTKTSELITSILFVFVLINTLVLLLWWGGFWG